MTSLVRKATFLCVCGLLIAGAAMAGVPASMSPSSPCLVLVGDNGQVAGVAPSPVIAAVQSVLTILVLDGTGNAVTGNYAVTIDFTGCVIGANGGIHVATQKSQRAGQSGVTYWDGVTPALQPATALKVDPALKTVSAITNNNGLATFIIEGGAGNSPGPPSVYTNTTIAGGCAKVMVGTTQIGVLTVSALNQDLVSTGASNPVNSADASQVLKMLVPVTQPYKSIADLDCNGSFTSADASVILQSLVFSNPPVGASNVCPTDSYPVANTANGYAW